LSVAKNLRTEVFWLHGIPLGFTMQCVTPRKRSLYFTMNVLAHIKAHPIFWVASLGGLFLMFPQLAFLAEEVGHGAEGGHGAFALTFLWIAIILLAAKISGLIEKWGQPSVLGELLIGVILGNLALLFGIEFFEPMKHSEILLFLAELGVVILLFQIGLESNTKDMAKVGLPALLVAVIGVIAPFGLGTWVLGPWLLPGLDFNTYLFLGAALTATSVGITARVFRDLGKLKSKETQIVLGAAVIDDILGLIILAVVSSIVTIGSVTGGTVLFIIGKAVAFLVAAIVIGQYAAGHIGKLLSHIQQGVGMKFTLAFSFGLVFAYLAHQIGLAAIVGAFAAGLILDPVAFRKFRRPEINEELDVVCSHCDYKTKKELGHIMDTQNQHHVEHLIEPIAFFVVPIFFVLTGMSVDLSTLADTSILLTALVITVAAFAGKLLAGVAAGQGVNKWIVGFGMVPRGEVGLIFATIGAGLGVVTDSVFSIIVIMVILTTLLTPPILTHLLKKQA